jgi:hypothetical protein
MLDRAEAALSKEARRKPPPLPRATGGLATTAGAPQTVIYRRAPTIVRVVHRRHDDGEHDESDGSELDD